MLRGETRERKKKKKIALSRLHAADLFLTFWQRISLVWLNLAANYSPQVPSEILLVIFSLQDFVLNLHFPISFSTTLPIQGYSNSESLEQLLISRFIEASAFAPCVVLPEAEGRGRVGAPPWTSCQEDRQAKETRSRKQSETDATACLWTV